MAQRRRRRKSKAGQAKEAYEAYIASDAWKAVRRRYKRERDWACAVCGIKRNLHLHHRTYVRLGKEELDDLIPLCELHHKQAHALVRAKFDLWDAHTRIEQREKVTVLPDAGRPHPERPQTRRWRGKHHKYKPRTKFFTTPKDLLQCEKCLTLYPPGHSKIRCEGCGGFIVYPKTKPGKHQQGFEFKRKAS